MRKVIDKINKRIHWRIVALIVALVMVSLVLFQFVLAEETPVQKRCEDDELPVLQTMLAEIPETDVEARHLVKNEIGALETGVAVCETITPVTVDPNKPLVFPTWSPPPFTTGIFEGQTGVFHSFEAKIENHWKGMVNGSRVTVFAGAWVNDPRQGFIKVKMDSVDPSTGRGHSVWSYHPSPEKNGALRILEARGARLIVQQANREKKLYFDVPALVYVSSLDEVVRTTPTASPQAAPATPFLYPTLPTFLPYPAPAMRGIYPTPTPYSPYPAP